MSCCQPGTSTHCRTGLALAITVGVFYTLCTLVWVIAPVPFLNFMKALFHGADFSNMVQPQSFDWGGFLTALVVMSVWAFLAGSFFAWLHERLTK